MGAGIQAPPNPNRPATADFRNCPAASSRRVIEGGDESAAVPRHSPGSLRSELAEIETSCHNN